MAHSWIISLQHIWAQISYFWRVPPMLWTFFLIMSLLISIHLILPSYSIGIGKKKHAYGLHIFLIIFSTIPYDILELTYQFTSFLIFWLFFPPFVNVCFESANRVTSHVFWVEQLHQVINIRSRQPVCFVKKIIIT